jgi:hypothetical protein
MKRFYLNYSDNSTTDSHLKIAKTLTIKRFHPNYNHNSTNDCLVRIVKTPAMQFFYFIYNDTSSNDYSYKKKCKRTLLSTFNIYKVQ